jgi:hypothetical protein
MKWVSGLMRILKRQYFGTRSLLNKGMLMPSTILEFVMKMEMESGKIIKRRWNGIARLRSRAFLVHFTILHNVMKMAKEA